MRVCEWLRISSWSGSDLRPGLAERLVTEYRERVSSAYVAPLSEADARRCLKLAGLIGAPYVLHLWDVLHGDVSRGALRELVDRADSVFCVSQPLLDDVSLIRSDAELLSFSRDASVVTASSRDRGPLKVVMHGNVGSYTEGLDDLDRAIALLERKGLKVEVSFLGSPRILRRATTTIKDRVNVGGFLPTQQDLDRELSRAHVAFLPGPKKDPRTTSGAATPFLPAFSITWLWNFPSSAPSTRPRQRATSAQRWSRWCGHVLRAGGDRRMAGSARAPQVLGGAKHQIPHCIRVVATSGTTCPKAQTCPGQDCLNSLI